MVGLIDTHAHLDAEQFKEDLPEVLNRAKQAGLEHLLAVGITAESSARCLELAEANHFVSATVGIHPNNLMQRGEGDWAKIQAMVANPRVVGIGETGLDRYWNDTPFAIQREWFIRHLELGRLHARPVIIHCRDAEPDVLEVLREQFDRHGPIRAVMHSFSGSQQTAAACLGMGLHLSFAGMLTYKNAGGLREVAAKVPLDRLLVETDCPYLAPVPLRGKRNEPSNMVHTATCLAELHNLSLEQVSELTTRNARALFGLKN